MKLLTCKDLTLGYEGKAILFISHDIEEIMQSPELLQRTHHRSGSKEVPEAIQKLQPGLVR